jgi:hypothetical protein
MRWAGNVSRNGDKMNAYKVFVAKSEGKRQLGRLKSRWDLREIELDVLD